MGIEITDVKITVLKSEDKMKALASIVVNNALAIHGLKVIEGVNGLFVAMPSRKTKDNEYKDIVHPITNELRQQIQSQVLTHYEEMVAATPQR